MALKLWNKGYKGFGQLGILLAFCGGGLIIGSLAGAGLWSLMTGQGIMNMEQDMLKPQFATAVKMVQAVSTFLIFFIPAVLFAFLCYKNGWQALGFTRYLNAKTLVICVIILLASMPLIDALTLFNKSIPISANARAYFDALEKSYESQVKIMGEVKNTGQFLASLILLALLPAIFEEVLFRGALQGVLVRWWKSPLVAILVTSILFSAIHGSWYGFIPRIALGMVLGLLFYYTQNLTYSIALHFFNNASVVTYMFIQTKLNKPVSVNTETSFPWWVAIFSVIALWFLFRWLIQLYPGPKPVEVYYNSRNPFDENYLANKGDEPSIFEEKA